VFFRLTGIKVDEYVATLCRPIISSVVLAVVGLATSEFFDCAVDAASNLCKLASLVLVGASVTL
jgi:hypothetical protein